MNSRSNRFFSFTSGYFFSRFFAMPKTDCPLME